MKTEYIPESNFYQIFKERLNKKDLIKNTDDIWGNYMSFKKDNTLIIDILECNGEYLFGTLGKPKNNDNLIRIRNKKDLSHVKIQGDTNLEFESYTYFLMEFNTGVITVLNSKIAPRIELLKYLLSHNPEYDLRIYPIRNTNIKEKLNKVESIGGIAMKFSKPPDELLGCDGLSAPYSIIHKFKDDGFDSFELLLSIDSRIKRKNNCSKIVNNVLDTYEVVKGTNNKYNLQKLSVLANCEDEVQESINILELYFTKGIKIKVDENFDEKIIKSYLISAYNNLKDDICKCITIHND